MTAAIANVDGPIARALRGRDATDQAGIDRALIDADGTIGKTKLGGNATVAVSLAAAHAAAAARRIPLWQHVADGAPVTLPLPEVQIFGGGACGKANRHPGPDGDARRRAVVRRRARDGRRNLPGGRRADAGAGKAAGVADEGGYWPLFDSNDDAIAMLVRAIERAGLRPGDDAAISLDIAASEFGRDGRYRLAFPAASSPPTAWRRCCCAGSTGFRSRRSKIRSPKTTPSRGDVLRRRRARACRSSATTSSSRAPIASSAAAAERACNAVLIKPNQAGTVTEARARLDAGKRAGFATIVSARSGETEDVSIAHLAVGWNAGQIKVGSFARGRADGEVERAPAHRRSAGTRRALRGRLRFCRRTLRRVPQRTTIRVESRKAASAEWRGFKRQRFLTEEPRQWSAQNAVLRWPRGVKFCGNCGANLAASSAVPPLVRIRIIIVIQPHLRRR